jgi:dipeptide transport system substrate-binding protein
LGGIVKTIKSIQLGATGILFVCLLWHPGAFAKTLVFCSEGSPENFAPSINTTGTSFDANIQIYDTLLEFERGGTKLLPNLVEKWTLSKDGREYVFSLRRGVKWQSGKNFTPSRDFNADDVLFMFERQWKESNPYFKVTSANHSYFSSLGLSTLVKAVEKIDDNTVRFTLNQPNAPFLASLAMTFSGVQSKEYADTLLKSGTPEKLDQEPIGTGPFALVHYQKDAQIRYKAFDKYWKGRAKIDDLIFSITPDPSVRWAKLQKGECHVMPYPNPADLDSMRRDPKVTVLEQPGLNVGYLAYNTTKKPFDDVRVRKALNMAIDRKNILNAVYLGTGVAAVNPIPPGLWSYNKATVDDPFNPEEARKLLAAAGYKEGFSTDLWAMPVQRPYNPNAKRIAELMQADLAKIGVKTEIKSFEWGEYRKRMQNGEHQMGMLGWTNGNGDPDDFFSNLLSCSAASANGGNVAKFCHPALEELIQKAKVSTVMTERTKLYERAQLIFKEQAPWFTIAHAVQLKPVRREVVDFRLSPFGDHIFYGVDIK